MPERRKASQSFFESRPADRIENQVHTLTAGKLHRLFSEVALFVVDHPIGAESANEIKFVVAENRTDYASARSLGDLHRGDPDAAGGGMHDHHIARARVVAAMDHVPRGKARDRKRRRLLEAHVVRNRGHARSADYRLFRVRAHADIRHAHSRLQSLDIRPDRLDHPGCFHPRRVREFGLDQIGAAQKKGVAVVDCDDAVSDEHGSRTELRNGNIAKFHDFRAAKAIKLDCFHSDFFSNSSAVVNKLSTSTGGYIDRRIKPHSDTWRQRNPPEAVIRYDTPALSQRRMSLPVRNSPGPREQQMAPRKPKRVAQVGVLGAQSSHLASCRQDARQTSTAINMIRQPDASLPCARMRPQRIPFFHGLRYIAHRTCGARLRWTNGHGSLRRL